MHLQDMNKNIKKLAEIPEKSFSYSTVKIKV